MAASNSGSRLSENFGPPDCITFILIENEAFLAEKRKTSKKEHPGALAIPGGHLEEQESPEAAFRRELKEELGVAPLEFMYVCTLLYRSPELRPLHYFAVTSWKGAIENNEAESLVWIPLDSLDRLDLEPDKTAIREYRQVSYEAGLGPG